MNKNLKAGIMLATFLAGPAVAQEARPLVETASGPVQGVDRDGLQEYLGIPYAAPPVGDLRWQPPAAPASWTEPLDASAFGATCPQVTTLGAFAGPTSVNEDCLSLNVFTTGSTQGDELKPVIVWIHGGGNFDGGSDAYDARKLATGGPLGQETVVVTINYRIGVLGYFSHPALNAEGHAWGNYGTLDQQAALRWVQDNIRAFGGDPDRVAVGGQSAGSYNTAAQLLSPASEGLFNRAILQSSPGFDSDFSTAEEAQTRGETFADAAFCEGSDQSAAACLRNLSVERILQLQGTPGLNSEFVNIRPIIDGEIIPGDVDTLWREGRFNRMPVMGGSTEDEGTFFTGIVEYMAGPPFVPVSADAYPGMIKEGQPCFFCGDGVLPAGVSDLYPLSAFNGNAMDAYQRLQTDVMKCEELRVLNSISQYVPTYAYDFTYQDAPWYFPQMDGFRADASHTIDIQFLFGGFRGGQLGVNLDQESGRPRELNDAEERLSDQMVGQWTNFAATGNPGIEGADWPAYDGSENATMMVQDIPLASRTMAETRNAYQCGFWDEHRVD